MFDKMMSLRRALWRRATGYEVEETRNNCLQRMEDRPKIKKRKRHIPPKFGGCSRVSTTLVGS